MDSHNVGCTWLSPWTQSTSYRPPLAAAPPYCHALPVAPNRLESLSARKPIRRRIWQLFCRYLAGRVERRHLFCGIRPSDCSLALLRVQWPGPTVRMPESKSLSSISGWWCRVAVGTDSRQNQVKLEQQFQCQFLRAMSEALRAHRFGHALNSDHLLKAPADAIDQLDQRYEPIHSIRVACGDCGFTR